MSFICVTYHIMAYTTICCIVYGVHTQTYYCLCMLRWNPEISTLLKIRPVDLSWPLGWDTGGKKERLTWLKAQFCRRLRIQFHGSQSSMHMILKAYCDCVLFLDFEGTGLCKAYIWDVSSSPLINIQSEEKKTKGQLHFCRKRNWSWL